MSSLFQDGCDCGQEKKKKHSPCKGCVCQQLMDLEKCNTFTSQTFLIVLKGDSRPLDLTGGGGPGTQFTFVSFDPRNCCARFTYTAAGRTETFVVDCRSIAGLSSVNTHGPSDIA